MSEYICHDFKTPRNDTSKRLPDSFKAIPIFFYVSIVGAIYFMTMDYLAYKKAGEQKLQAELKKEDLDAQSAKLNEEKALLDAETASAEALAKWMEGARNVQPIGTLIARAMPPEVRISDLSFERSQEMPANIAMSVRINGGSSTEIGLLESSVAKLNYRPFAAQQSKDGEIIEYRATLVRQE